MKVADKILCIEGIEVFHYVNKKLKNSYLQIKENQVILKTPFKNEDRAYLLLEEKLKWIQLKLNSSKETIKYDLNSEFLYLNELINIKNDKRFKNFKSNLSEENLQKQHDIYYKKIALEFLAERLEIWAKTLSLEYSEMKVRKMKRRWGSCSSKRVITFNIYLMKHSLEVIDYVIVHELSHLLQMNHSKKFYAIIAKYLPNYKATEKQIQTLKLGY